MILGFLKRLLAPRLPAETPAQRLDGLAAAMVFEDPELAHCWELARAGIQTQKLGLGNMGRWIAHLRAGNGMGADEFSMDIDEQNPNRAVVQLLDDARTCPAPALIAALDSLRERAERQENP